MQIQENNKGKINPSLLPLTDSPHEISTGSSNNSHESYSVHNDEFSLTSKLDEVLSIKAKKRKRTELDPSSMDQQ